MNDLQIYNDEFLLGDLITLDAQQLTPDYYVLHYAEFLSQYVAKARPSGDTLKDYSTEIKNFISWCQSHKAQPLALQEQHCRIYLRYLAEKNYSSATINLKMAAVKTFYSIAVKLGLITKNPCAEIFAFSSFDSSDDNLKFLDDNQIKYVGEKILDEPDEILRKRNLAIFMLMAVEGLRNIEVHRMNDEDINFELNSIFIRGKGHNNVIYPCHDTIFAIKDYLKIRPALKKDGVLTPTFISLSNFNRGQRITRAGIRWAINQILTLCNLKVKGHSCHMLRHSCATNLYQATKDLRLVQETLRHRSPTMTARYAHIYGKMNNRQTEKISPFSKQNDDD